MASEVKKLNILDCFCGLGGTSEGFAREGFDCTGIDIINVGYPYRFVLGDMATLKGEDFRNYDVIWGSPPCRNFTILPDSTWKIKKDPKEGMKLVNVFLKFVEDAQPKFWIMENVQGLSKYLPKPKIQNARIFNGKRHVFYGNFPNFLIPHTVNPKIQVDLVKGKYRSWQRAKIPSACSQAFARACKEQLLCLNK